MNSSRRSAKLSPAQIKKLLIILALVLVVLTALVLVLRNRVKQQFGREEEREVLSASVTTGSISSSVYGSGLLADEDVEQLDIPSGVDVETICVSRGEKVEEGQLLASVEQSSVITAMASVSEELSKLDESIASAMNQTAGTLIRSSVSGRVKKIYAQYGDDVADVMLNQGALMLLSLDGYMAVELETDRLSPGDSLTVTDSSGRAYIGTVEQVVDSTATVLITDKDPQYGDTVRITDVNGEELGSGTLTIHDPMKVMGYTGTVSSVYTSENAQIYSGSSLLGLSDTQNGAAYASLLKERAELEDTLAELLDIYQTGGICAPFSGTVKEISVTELEEKTGTEESTQEYFTLSPDRTMSLSLSVDETQILSVSNGQKASVTVDAIEGRSYQGSVTQIDQVGTSSSGVTTYTALISVEKQDTMLSGMSASAVISIDSVEDALLIPIDALQKTASTYYVYTSYDEAAQTLGSMVEVTVGVTNSQYAEIRSGLSEGNTVYYMESSQSSGGFMPGGEFSGGMPSGGGDFGGGMPSGGNFGGGRPSGGFMPGGRG